MIPNRTFSNLSQTKQRRIIREAVAEFGEKGFGKASINAMVRRLGIAKGSMFQYFGDKKGLFMFVFADAMETVKDYLRTVRDQTAGEDIYTRLEATLIAGLLFSQKHPRVFRLYIRTLFEDDIPFRDEILMSLRSYSLKYLHSLLQTARQRGELRPDLDLDAAAFVLDAVMDRFLQAGSVKHLDGGMGLFECGETRARAWIAQLVSIMKQGLMAVAP